MSGGSRRNAVARLLLKIAEEDTDANQGRHGLEGLL